MKIFAFLLALVSFSALAQNLKLENYLKMQDALASDDFKTALSAHSQICAKDISKFKKEYKDCSKKFKDIGALRKSFKSMSKLFIAKSDKLKFKEVEIVECPMAKAQWIQAKGGIRNPYYGSSMLMCGEKIKL